jgi:hypothetical protein
VQANKTRVWVPSRRTPLVLGPPARPRGAIPVQPQCHWPCLAFWALASGDAVASPGPGDEAPANGDFSLPTAVLSTHVFHHPLACVLSAQGARPSLGCALFCRFQQVSAYCAPGPLLDLGPFGTVFLLRHIWSTRCGLCIHTFCARGKLFVAWNEVMHMGKLARRRAWSAHDCDDGLRWLPGISP